jgi:predicted dehydrogenase
MTRRLRVGILGAGAAAAEIHAPGYAACQSAELVAVASATRASADRLAERFGIPTVHPTPEGLLHDPDVDAVSVCTPPALHRDLAERACAAGKHVLIEKPIATALEDVEALREMAARTATVVDVVRNERFMAFNRQAKELVATGAVGDVQVILQTISTDGPESWSPTARWFRDPARSGGGAMLDLAVHKADLAAWLTDRPPVVVPGRRRSGAGGVEEAGLLVAELEGGVPSVVHASWRGPKDESSILISGTLGVLVGVSSSGTLSVHGSAPGTWRTVPPWSSEDDSAQLMIADFVRNCLAGTRPVEHDPLWDAGTRMVLLHYAAGGADGPAVG